MEVVKKFNLNVTEGTMVVNNTNITIVGDYETPFFSGKEMCEALGYKNSQKALFTHVKPKHKMTLDELNKVQPAEGCTFLWPFNDLSYNEGKAVYITEHGAYHLAMKCQLPIGDDFRDWLAGDVVPSLRKTGQYKLMKERDDQLSESMEKLNESMSLLALERQEGVKTRSMLEQECKARQEAEKQQKIAELRSLTLTRLNVAFQERVKTQIFYIVTSKLMAGDNEFKIGGVENHSLLKKRLSMYNTGNSGVHLDLKMFFVFLVEVSNYKQMEMRMKELLLPFRSKRHANTENFNLHFNILKPLTEMGSRKITTRKLKS
jgi:prophage antirepressor-like protein